MGLSSTTRWTRTLGVTCLVGALLLGLGRSGGATGPGFVAGGGSAQASVIRIAPTHAGLQVALTLGQSLADYQGNLGRAQSRTLDPGVLATVLTAENCKGEPPRFDPSNLPATTRVETRDDTRHEDGATYLGGGDGPVALGAGHQRAVADEGPVGESVTTLAVLDIPGLIVVDGGRASARSGIVGGTVRESRATAEVERLDLFGGEIRLEGLVWDVVHRSGPNYPDDNEEVASFRVGRVEIGGQELPVPETPEQTADLFDAINGLIAPTGYAIDVPRAVVHDDTVRLTPLAFRVDRSPVGRATVGEAVGALQPIREPIAEYLIEWDCQAAGFFLVADVTIGPFSGAGGLHIELGGGFAMSEGQSFESTFGELPTAMGPGTFDVGPGERTAADGAERPLTRGGPAPAPAPAAPTPEAGSSTPTGDHVSLGQPVGATRSPDRLLPAAALALAGIGGLAAGEWAQARRRRFLIEEVA